MESIIFDKISIMKFFIITITLFAATVFSCTNTPEPKPVPVTIGQLSYTKSEGPDCDKPDSLRLNCAAIHLQWPETKTGSDALKKTVTAWAEGFLISLLAPPLDSAAPQLTTVDAAAQNFFQTHREWTKEAPESVLSYYVAESTDSVLLNDGRHLTLMINGYAYMGGAHGSPQEAVRSFDVQTGKLLAWPDLVTDTVAVKTLAEKKFRTVRADLFQQSADGSPGFDFDDVFVFQLPVCYGLTQQGIYFHYQHYEVTPYAFGTTDFVIPFAELGALKK